MKVKAIEKRVLSVFMTGGIAVSFLACAAASESSHTEDSDVYDTQKQSQSEAFDATEKKGSKTVSDFPAKDLGGRTIQIGLWWDEYWDSNYQSLEDITAAGGTYGSEKIMQMKLDAVRAVEKKWNCKVEWVNLGWDGIIDSINTSVTAGMPDCDIYVTDMQFGVSPIVNGYVQKISDYAPADADVLNNQNVFTKQDVLGSDDYLFHESSTIPDGAMYLCYNADLIDSLGLTRPEELAEKGEWTWDKFAEYAKACTLDTDGDGAIDIYGYGDAWVLTVQGFCASNNACIADSTSEGLSDPKTVATFKFIDRLYNIDKTARPYQDNWDDDSLAFSTGKAAFAFAQTWVLSQELNNHDFDVRICPAPVGPDGDGSMTPAMMTHNYMIPMGVEDPTAVYEVFEEMMNWYKGDISLRDDPEWFNSVFSDKDQIELATKLGSYANNDLWNVIDTEGAVSSVFYGDIVYGDCSVSQAIDANKQILQNELNTCRIKDKKEKEKNN